MNSTFQSALNPDSLQSLFTTLESVVAGIKEQYPSDEKIQEIAGTVDALKNEINHLQTQTKLLLGLAETSQLVNSSLEIEAVLTSVMDTIIQITGAERCFLSLLSPEGDPEIRIARNWEKESLQSEEVQFSHTIISQVVKDHQPIMTTNAQSDDRFAGQKSVMMYQLRSILCVPLITKEVCIGVIYADNRIRSGIFDKSMMEHLLPFANQAAIAIENARLFQQIQLSLAEVQSLKQTMDNIFASISSGVLTTDDQLRVTMQNASAEKIIGKPADEIQMAPIRDVLLFSEALDSCFTHVMTAQESITGMEMQMQNPLLGQRDVRFSISPLKNEAAKVVGTAMVLEDYTDQKRLQANFDLFERMVSPAVIAQLQNRTIETGGERKTISVIFADIRGFTGYSERHSPEALVSVLNRYLAAAANVILEEGGTIDKFLGDAVMAWFNAPIQQEDYLLRAVRSALGIRAVVNRLNQSMPEEDRLSFGIGIHSGEAVLGLIGAQKRMDFTAIGDAVNTAKRVQEHAGAGQILLSESVKNKLAHQIEVNPQPLFQAKGKAEPLSVYELIALSSWGTP